MATEKRLIDANSLRNAFRKRMIERFDKDLCANEENCKTCYPGCSWIHIIAKEPTVDAVEVPCRMGDSVWGIKIYNHGREVKQGVVHQMFFGEDMRLCICVKNVCRGEWGKNVFATKEEAEAALAKMDGDGNG